MALYNIYYAKHGADLIRVGHDELVRWYMSVDGAHWTPVDDHTLKSALNDAHRRLRHPTEECQEKLDWKLDELTRAQILGQCPRCTNPAMNSYLKTYRSCPDCGWRIDFTDEQIQWVENKLKESRQGLR